MSETDRHHVGLSDTFASRRYFRKFEAITGHLGRVAAVLESDGTLDSNEVRILARYVLSLAFTFRALSMKYLLAGRDTGQFFGSLTMDSVESGFPAASELLVMANDAQQADRHLANMPSVAALKRQMVDQIVGRHEVPTRLQFALSQRLYYEELKRGKLFWARNDPVAEWQGGAHPRTSFRLHWAVYDSQVNLPTIYLLDLDDTGATPLPKDSRRWPEVQAHLMGQSLGGLKLLTIARGFDESFDHLHPKRLRRVHLGPMYSHAFTRQSGPIRAVLEAAKAPPGQDWTLAATLEELESARVETERKGWFGQVEREVFALDPFSGQGAETGATRMERMVILPERPFQVLSERNPPGFAALRKFVVGDGGRVLRY